MGKPDDSHEISIDVNGPLSARERAMQGWRDRGYDMSAHGIAGVILEKGADPIFGSEAVSMWFLGQLSQQGGTEISQWDVKYIFDSLNVKSMEQTYSAINLLQIKEGLNTLDRALDRTGTAFDAEMASAVAKQSLSEMRKEKIGRYAFDMTENEMAKYDIYEKIVASIQLRCRQSRYQVKETLDTYIDYAIKNLEGNTLLGSGLLEDWEENKIIDRLDKSEEREEGLLAGVVHQVKQTGEPGVKNEESVEWGDLKDAMTGALQVFNGCRQWLTNQYDLEPILKVWEYQSRMVELHPSDLEAMAKQFPSFNEALKGICALASGKYALGSNGEIYPSGRYGLGFVDKAGKIVDVDDAYNGYSVNEKGERTGLKADIKRLKSDEILVNSKVEKVEKGKCNIDGSDVNIFSENILYNQELKDEDVKIFADGITDFTRARDKDSSYFNVNFGVELAREFFEMSMLSNWYGAARDSKGRPYYAKYKITGVNSLTGGAKLDKDLSIISSNPESDLFKTGAIAIGWDEGSLFPSWVNDWGKLTLTRTKQASELFKARKHGLYALIPWMPENLVKPFLDQDQINKLVESTGDIKDMFGDMQSIAKLKKYWLNIAKGASVYEFLSSNFIGDKDVTKAGEELLALFMQPRTLEGLNKSIDLSLSFADPWEGARLKVNIVLAGLATVAKELSNEEFLGVAPQRLLIGGRLQEEDITVINKVEKIKDLANIGKVRLALRQLATSRFIGDEDDIMKVIQRIIDFRDGKTGDLGFTMKEFQREFGDNYIKEVWGKRQERKEKVMTRVKGKKTL